MGWLGHRTECRSGAVWSAKILWITVKCNESCAPKGGGGGGTYLAGSCWIGWSSWLGEKQERRWRWRILFHEKRLKESVKSLQTSNLICLDDLPRREISSDRKHPVMVHEIPKCLNTTWGELQSYNEGTLEQMEYGVKMWKARSTRTNNTSFT